MNTYPGGKNGAGVFQFIINRIPPHKVYLEGFLGGGAILRNKRPAELNIGIDLDPEAIQQTKEQMDPWPAGKDYSFPCGDFTDFLDQIDRLDYASDQIFIYLDPPYLMETRKRQEAIYKFEMTRDQHEQLLKLIKDRNELIMISGYKSDLYERELAHWRVESFNAITRGGSIAREHLWMNYPPPTQLHDYKFLGVDFTDRQRIKRKIARKVQQLAALPALERAAILNALIDDIDRTD